MLRSLCLLASVAVLTGVEAGNFLEAGLISKADVADAFKDELSSGQGAAISKRVAMLEDSLRTTYKSLPKTAAGNLGHHAVRYVLHRHFVQQHGWFIRGLEPNNNTWTSKDKPAVLNEWVPGYLQELLEERLGERGTNLRELAGLAAALEDLVRKEAMGRLELAYQLHGVPTTQPAPEPELEEVVNTYLVEFLNAGNFTANSQEELELKEWTFARRYVGYTEVMDWLAKLKARRFSPERTGKLSFTDLTGLALDIGEEYHDFNDGDCKSLKSTLQALEGKKAGRVRLSIFYKTGLHSHWRFTEKAEYLRALGALDETDPEQPLVIVPNYVMARTNCLEASRLYAICCRNECEDLMGHVEKRVGDNVASPQQVVALIANLPSDTMAAPRNLSDSLVGRLQQVALVNNGRVPLHGRLFAQWMHHAYPHECPYPHEVGLTNPQTPDEWMKETGHADSSATREEMQQLVESDSCASDAPQTGHGCGEEEDPELPWSEAEELLLVQRSTADDVAANSTGRAGAPQSRSAWARRAVAAAVGTANFLALDYWQAVHGKQGTPGGCWSAVLLTLLAWAAHLFGLLDGSAVACTLCVSLLKTRLGVCFPWRDFGVISSEATHGIESV